MARRGGFQGMPGNMSNIMKQAQRMQRQMAEKQQELQSKEYTATAGGSAVTAKVNGKRELISVTIAPEAVDPDDVEMLQDLIVAAVNQAMKLAEDESTAEMEKLTGGLGGLGGGLSL